MEKATKNNSNTQTKHKNRRINKRILTSLLIPIVLVMALLTQHMSAFAALPAAYKVPGYNYGDTKPEWNKTKKTFTMYTGSSAKNNSTTWGIKVSDLNKLNGYTKSNANTDYFYHELADIHSYCAYASITSNAASQNSLATSFWWNPSKDRTPRDDGSPILWRMVYMQLYDIKGKDTGALPSDLDSVCFGGDNPAVYYICYELDKNGKLLTNVGADWTSTKVGYTLQNPDKKTRYLLFYFKIADGKTAAGSDYNSSDTVTSTITYRAGETNKTGTASGWVKTGLTERVKEWNIIIFSIKI